MKISSLNSLKDKIKKKYQKFISGHASIKTVLQKPVELAQVAFSLFFEALNIKLTQGISIQVESNIPIGCGMGSSAATILSIVHAMAAHLKVDLSNEMFMRLGREAENLQHGFSSGLDLQASLHGGCVYLEAGLVQQRALPKLTLYLINTGTPLSTTGECVAFAAKSFKDADISRAFGEVTSSMDHALQLNKPVQVMECISKNHQLLVRIGVVPTRVQAFIAEIEAIGGAAKVCGAGAVKGESAGMVAALIEDLAALTQIADCYGYEILPITGDARGVHVI